MKHTRRAIKNNTTTGTRRTLGVINRSGKLEVAAQHAACRLGAKYQADKITQQHDFDFKSS